MKRGSNAGARLLMKQARNSTGVSWSARLEGRFRGKVRRTRLSHGAMGTDDHVRLLAPPCSGRGPAAAHE